MNNLITWGVLRTFNSDKMLREFAKSKEPLRFKLGNSSAHGRVIVSEQEYLRLLENENLIKRLQTKIEMISKITSMD